jgi:hypothetical protein
MDPKDLKEMTHIPTECQHPKMTLINRKQRRTKEYIKDFGNQVFHAFCPDCKKVFRRKNDPSS